MKGPQNQFAITIAKAWLFLAFAFVSVASAQNVGIGLSNPASKLTVNGNLAIGAGYVGIMFSLAQELQNSLISPVPVAAMLSISSGYRIVAHRLRPILSPI